MFDRNGCRFGDWVLVLTITGWCGGAEALGSDELLDEVKSGHQAALNAIRTLSATYRYEETHPRRVVISEGSYHRKGDWVRVEEGETGKWASDLLLKDGEVRTVHRQWDPNSRVQYAAERASSAMQFGLSDMYVAMHLLSIGPRGQPMTFHQLLERVSRAPKVSRERVDGRRLIKVQVEFDGEDGKPVFLTKWFDPGVNYLIRQSEVSRGGDWRSVSRVLEFAEPVPSVFVPTVCEGENATKNRKQLAWRIQLTEVKVNQPLPDQLFQLPAIPSGTVVFDRTNETEYPVDANWQRTGEAKPRPIQRNAYEFRPDTKVGYEQPTSEPSSIAWWIVYVSAGMLVLSLVLLAIRRTFRRSE